MKFIRDAGVEEILAHECFLRRTAVELLRDIPGIVIYASPDGSRQTGVLSFTSRQLPVETVAQRLSERGVCVRAGLHCAPLAHQTAGTVRTGTVRLSPGWFQTKRQIERFVKKLAIISGKESTQILE